VLTGNPKRMFYREKPESCALQGNKRLREIPAFAGITGKLSTIAETGLRNDKGDRLRFVK